MEMTTNVTILIPSKKVYSDYAIRMESLPNDKASGQWQLIDYMPTPARQGYARFNSFIDKNGDAFLDKGSQIGYHLFLFKLGKLRDPMMNMFSAGFAHIVMDVKEHIFSPKKELWAKKAALIPQMTEIIAIFWK